MPKLKAVDPFSRRKILIRQKLAPMGRTKERKKATLALQFIREVEEALPGANGDQKKAWVKKQIDNLIQLPPIAEEISDFIISLTVEAAYAGVQAAKKRGEYSDDLADAKKQIKTLKGQVTRLKKQVAELNDG